SKRIKGNAERTRLKKIVEGIKPPNFGVIIRTVSEGKGVAELQKDLLDWISKWELFTKRLRTVEPPQKILGEMDRTSTILRDLLSDDFSHLYVNESVVYEKTRAYIQGISPDLEKIVKLYKHKEPIFQHFAVERQVKTAFGKTVNRQCGAY